MFLKEPRKRLLFFLKILPKNGKKCLTKGEGRANICKLSARAGRRSSENEECVKNLKKVLDKRNLLC